MNCPRQSEICLQARSSAPDLYYLMTVLSCEIDLYKSNDAGRNWTYVSTIAEGKAAYPGNDPVWEPFLMVANNKLICYYSDERDTAHSQKLVHQTTTDGINWSSVVNDVALSESSQMAWNGGSDQNA